jgi:hypothetical protein
MRRLLVALEILGHGFSKHDLSIYKIWWHEFKRGRGHVEPGARPGKVQWYEIKIESEDLLKWVSNQLRLEQPFKIPYLIKELHVDFEIPRQMLKQWLKDYLNLAETPEGYVKRWWKLSDSRAVPFSTLIGELRHSIWKPEKLAKPLFGSAGRNRPKQLRAATEDIQTAELGNFFGTLIKLGFVFTTHIKEILEERFQRDENPEQCAKALQALHDLRPVSLSTFQEWKQILNEIFGAETMKTFKIAAMIDQEVVKQKPPVRREKHEALVLMRAIEKGDPGWRNHDGVRESLESLEAGQLSQS